MELCILLEYIIVKTSLVRDRLDDVMAVSFSFHTMKLTVWRVGEAGLCDRRSYLRGVRCSSYKKYIAVRSLQRWSRTMYEYSDPNEPSIPRIPCLSSIAYKHQQSQSIRFWTLILRGE